MKYLLLVAFLLCTQFSFSQEMKAPVKWQITLKKETNNTYLIVATANIDKGFHVFTNNPGGDGLLIPTTIEADASEQIEKGNIEIKSNIITKEMEAVGMVNYVEGVAVFTMTVKKISNNPTRLKGFVTYQCCNETMCFPPVDVPFSFELK